MGGRSQIGFKSWERRGTRLIMIAKRYWRNINILSENFGTMILTNKSLIITGLSIKTIRGWTKAVKNKIQQA